MNQHWTVSFDHTLSTLTCVREGTRGYDERRVFGDWTVFVTDDGSASAVRLDDAARATNLSALNDWVPTSVVAMSRYVFDLALSTRTDLVMATSAWTADVDHHAHA
ncbi:MAG: hypothetical protein R2743_03525 [Ilumatobacteraceae bacterium]